MHRQLLIISIIIFASCNQAPLSSAPQSKADRNTGLIREAAALVKTGDVIFRCGKDVTSYRIRELSEKDKTYSHAGIAVVKPEGIFIYHISPPELNEPRGDTVVRLESLEKFADPEKNFELGIGRFPLTQEEDNLLIAHMDSLKRNGTSFDFLFDLSTSNKMYCSEMIDEALRSVTGDSITLKRNNLSNPAIVKKVSSYLKIDEKEVRSRPFIPIENIYLSRFCKMIAQYKFEQ